MNEYQQFKEFVRDGYRKELYESRLINSTCVVGQFYGFSCDWRMSLELQDPNNWLKKGQEAFDLHCRGENAPDADTILSNLARFEAQGRLDNWITPLCPWSTIDLIVYCARYLKEEQEEEVMS